MGKYADNLQAAGAMIQAGTSLVDSFLNLGRLLCNTAQALHLLKNAGLEMDTMVPKLNEILRSAREISDTYWSPNKRFKEWVNMVTDTCNSVEKLSKSYKEVNGLQMFYAPAVITGEIQKICVKIDKCVEEGKALEDALQRRATRRVVLRDLININNVDTLIETRQQILVKLKSERTVLINLFGEFGTGKSVILDHLNNDETIRNKYDIVIWASASSIENPDKDSNIVAHIQHDVAKRLGIDIQGNNVNTVAEKIDAELKGAKYLLLLDDVKDKFNVNDIGLPRNDNGSKIVITSINPFVFEGPTIFVKSGRLAGVESWQMFKNLLKKDDLLEHHDIETIARKVVTWCDGHFLLLKIAAETFKLEDTAESWVSCFKMLKSAPMKEDMYMKAMKQILHLGYETLTEKQKLCFLFCALYPKENGSFGGKIPIHCLFDCWAALKFLDYDKVPSPSGDRILKSLIRKSLLIEDSNKQYVIMSKLLRGVALHYLEQDRQLIKGYVAIEKPEEQKLDGFTTIQWLSFANCNIKAENIPTNKRFEKVTALFLQKNSELEDIPREFIDHMNELQVLDLHKTRIKSIIPVRNLRNLKVLYVNSCNLLQSFSMDKEGLDELEVLDIRGNVQIPDDIKKLKKLRRLMISICGGCYLDLLCISGILQLKELIVDLKSDNSSKEKDYDHNRVVTRIIESIHNLDELCTLQIHFQHVVVPVIKVLDTFSKISVPNLESLVHLLEGKAFLEHEDLEVYIGLEPNVEISTIIHVNNSFIRPYGKEPGKIYSKVQTLILIKNDEICNISNDEICNISTSTGDMNMNMNDIHSCLVYECNKVETFMKTAGFSSLKILILSKCSALKVLFSNNTLLEMGIEHLEIRDCPAIEDIDIVSDGGGGIMLPSLMTLVLYNLPELKLEKSLMSWPLLKTLRMHRCGNMTKLPFKVDGPTELRVIEVEQTWWDEKLQLSDSIKMRFEGYCKFSDMPV